jgi:hypothetical protein
MGRDKYIERRGESVREREKKREREKDRGTANEI